MCTWIGGAKFDGWSPGGNQRLRDSGRVYSSSTQIRLYGGGKPICLHIAASASSWVGVHDTLAEGFKASIFATHADHIVWRRVTRLPAGWGSPSAWVPAVHWSGFMTHTMSLLKATEAREARRVSLIKCMVEKS